MLKVLALAKVTHALDSNYDVFNRQCYRFADTLWTIIFEKIIPGVTVPDLKGASRFLAVNCTQLVAKDHEEIYDLYEKEWDRIQDLMQKKSAVSLVHELDLCLCVLGLTYMAEHLSACGEGQAG